jgi:Ca2+-binding EF-hand superfamily protein
VLTASNGFRMVTIHVLACVAVQVLSAATYGQPDGRGGPPLGGFSPFGGGPSDFLRRMDNNGNGMLDPDETQGRARFFLERIAADVPGIDLNRPIPIDRLTQAMERMRQQRSSGSSSGPPMSGSPSGSASAGPSSGGPSSGGSSRSRSTAPEPLVPAFGVVEALTIPPGFGAAGAIESVRVEPDDTRQAEERFQRYDANRDGVLSTEEVKNGRWSDDPMVYDRNGDGKLTVNELAVRYARRRTQQTGSSPSGSSTSPSSRSPSSGTSSVSVVASSSSGSGDQRTDMVDGIVRRYDRNGNGVLEKEEYSESRFIGPADANNDGKITREEITTYFQSRMSGFGRGDDRSGGGGSSWFGRGGDRGDGGSDASRGSFFTPREGGGRDSGGGRNGSTPAPASVPSYRFRRAEERLPENLPAWFAQNDQNANGQVSMAEFSSAWTDQLVADFRQFDLNRDGVITPQECLRASSNGAVRGLVSAPPATASSTSGTPAAPATAGSASTPAPTAVTSPTATVDERYLAFARRIIGKNDENGDGALSTEECMKMSSNPSAADANKDGKVTLDELAAWYKSQG